MSAASWRLWISRALAAVATVGATAALVVFLVAAAASAHPLLAERAGID
jgi:hypothetical protein